MGNMQLIKPSTNCRSFVESRLDSWTQLFQTLIQTSSVFEHEHEISQFVARHITSLGVQPQKVRHDPTVLRNLSRAQPPISEVDGRFSVAARVPGHGQGRSMIISTHLDVVPAGCTDLWNYQPFGGYIDRKSNIIYGRGAMDDKAGVVISLALLECLSKGAMQLQGDVVFHYVLEDETTGNGTLLCLDSGHDGDAAMILDGTRTDKAINQHAGNMEFAIRVQGKSASVCVSHLGVNSAELLASLLLKMKAAVHALNESRRAPWTQFPSPYQFVVQKLESASAHLLLPEMARAKCYCTFPPPRQLSDMRQLLQSEADRFASESNLDAAPEFDWSGFATEPVEATSHHLESLLQQIATSMDMERIAVGPSTGTSDLRHFIDAGIPCLLYGPGTGFNPHRADEHYHLDDLRKMIMFYLTAVSRWCGVAKPALRRAA